MRYRPLLAVTALIASLAVFPASAAEAAGPLVVVNPGWEQGTTGWTFTAGTGVATNRPHGGTRLIYLDSGAGKSVRQAVTVPTTGRYTVSAWISTGGANGTFAVTRNGAAAGSITLPSRSTYSRFTISNVAVTQGDRLEIVFGSGASWVNADDVMVSPGARANPSVTSSNAKIVAMFDWSKAKAGSWSHQAGVTGRVNVDERQPAGTGDATYASTYWAGYAHRSGYYSRDFAHQVSGAHLLGMDVENKTMLRSFAKSATAQHKYYPVWAFNFDAATYLSIDYKSTTNFVREVPATFELVEKANAAYRWTGDRSYVDDPVFWDYYRHATNEFVGLHDTRIDNDVAEGTGQGIFAGAASYNEQGNERLAEAGDAIGAQYQAYRALAALARDKCADCGAAEADARADALKRYFNDTWSRKPGSAEFVRAYNVDGAPLTGWGKENSWFMPMKGIVDAGTRNEAYLDYIDAQASGSGRPSNIEAVSYLPDTFFRHNRNETAWKWMQDVYDKRDAAHAVSRQGLNGDYPEVPFTLVSQTVEGLMGVTPDAPARTVTTLSRLPGAIGWLQVADIPVGPDSVTVRHDGQTSSKLTNRSSSSAYTWEARFLGQHPRLEVNGVAQPGRTKVVDGVTYTYAPVTVTPGATATVRVV